jgi:hypothetical protein
VFVRDPVTGIWSEEQLIENPLESYKDQFGTSVAVSGYGNRFVVGAVAAYGEDDPPTVLTNPGSAWVYVKVDGVWEIESEINPLTQTEKASYGNEVGISDDGSVVLVGAFFNGATQADPLQHDGAVWLWERSGGVWTEYGMLGAPGAPELGSVGTGVAVAGDGLTVTFTGGTMFWTYVLVDGEWELHGTSVSSALGPMALSQDGTVAIVGDQENNQAQVYRRTPTSWTEVATLTPDDMTGDANAGWSVGLSGDGTIAAIGGPFDSAHNPGAMWVFRDSTPGEDTWEQQFGKYIPDDYEEGFEPGTDFGWSIDVSGDSLTIVVGGPYDNAYAGGGFVNGTGAAWAFVQEFVAGEIDLSDVRFRVGG